MGAGSLRSVEFRREREASWRELEDLVSRVERYGLQVLDPEEVERLPELYRGVISSLSVARNISLDKNLTAWLEALASRAYLAVYSTRRRFFGSVAAFFRRTYPRLVWGMRLQLIAAMLTFAAGSLAGYTLTQADPEYFYGFVSEAMAGERGPLATRAELEAVLFHDGSGSEGELSAFASFLFSNNAGIGLLCFVLGFAAGVPVLLLLFVNGLTLGAMTAIHVTAGLTTEYWAWLLPHGVTELLAICVCGAAGLRLGGALVFPGRHRRLDELALRGREAAAVAVGTVSMFFVAALIEGFFRQLVHDATVRLSLATLTAVMWALYFGPYARRSAADERLAGDQLATDESVT